ncbi:aldehyde dehydrogenase family protein [Hydrogenibacillus sp. N12]|uniref:3-sulfolactaldehyde dehydrogenase n=1 Tax=Hydrogenibacillus schlegelii TaxID=1484 RepID=A0A947CZ56_HYDSH|nr:aldehyde dehydrogenase family protein [Hydrogenibacillus sp. N12]MBT9282510.1 aldehyde dehydrogenase family protein [Hydrogenibacillus schlegelii]QZA31983.1 aldehyde dehydrogenase family protein [Hydrogenibacillus sp. N12]
MTFTDGGRKGLWIGGRYEPAASWTPVVSKADGRVLAEVGRAGADDARRAVKAAAEAYPTYRRLPAHARAAILYRVAEALETRREEVARLIAEEAGKPLKAARAEVLRAVQTYRFSAEEAKRIGGETIPMDAAVGGEGRLGFTWREPLGVVAAITPFNFPLNLVAHKLGPALAAGNTVVLKPAGATPLSSFFVAELFHEAGLPAGALNVVSGPGGEIGDALVEHPDVKAITFTGSPTVGKRIREKSGLKRTILELGSNSAVIVEPDAPFDLAVARTVEGAFQYAGQICISVQRIYVHAAIYERFYSALLEKTKALRVGDPRDEATDVGPLIHEGEAARVQAWIEEAVAAGARIAAGGRKDGAFLEPTILTDVTPEMKVVREEVFGPVATLVPYRNLDEAIALVNDSKYGLNVGVFTRDIGKAFDAARRLETGGVMINDIPTFRVDHMPYGGMKESGFGREGVKYAIEELTELKFIMVNLNL